MQFMQVAIALRECTFWVASTKRARLETWRRAAKQIGKRTGALTLTRQSLYEPTLGGGHIPLSPPPPAKEFRGNHWLGTWPQVVSARGTQLVGQFGHDESDGSIHYVAELGEAKNLRLFHDFGIVEIFADGGAVCGTRHGYVNSDPDRLEISTTASTRVP
ncbi:hypothetical protein J2X71_004275 [Rhizobium sp. 1399]|nr:hypothetical protein [Rhizobium sp. 1399]